MNNVDSFEYHKKLADEGNPFSAYIVGVHYELGIEVEANKELQERYFLMSARGGNSEACFKLGEFYLARKEITLALYWFAKGATQGEPQAQNAMGILCERNVISGLDSIQCFYWYTLSADSGYDEGQYNLARMYEKGIGVEIDEQKAFSLYEKASSENYAPALLKLAEYYENGFVVEKNLAKAKELRELATDNS